MTRSDRNIAPTVAAAKPSRPSSIAAIPTNDDQTTEPLAREIAELRPFDYVGIAILIPTHMMHVAHTEMRYFIRAPRHFAGFHVASHFTTRMHS